MPNGDRRVGMDIWHCPGCRHLWQQSAKTGNIIAGATAAVVPAVVVVGIAAPVVPVLVGQGVTYLVYTLPATPFVVDRLMNWAAREGAVEPAGEVLNGIKEACGASPGSCPDFMTPQWPGFQPPPWRK